MVKILREIRTEASETRATIAQEMKKRKAFDGFTREARIDREFREGSKLKGDYRRVPSSASHSQFIESKIQHRTSLRQNGARSRSPRRSPPRAERSTGRPKLRVPKEFDKTSSMVRRTSATSATSDGQFFAAVNEETHSKDGHSFAGGSKASNRSFRLPRNIHMASKVEKKPKAPKTRESNTVKSSEEIVLFDDNAQPYSLKDVEREAGESQPNAVWITATTSHPEERENYNYDTKSRDIVESRTEARDDHVSREGDNSDRVEERNSKRKFDRRFLFLRNDKNEEVRKSQSTSGFETSSVQEKAAPDTAHAYVTQSSSTSSRPGARAWMKMRFSKRDRSLSKSRERQPTMAQMASEDEDICLHEGEISSNEVGTEANLPEKLSDQLGKAKKEATRNRKSHLFLKKSTEGTQSLVSQASVKVEEKHRMRRDKHGTKDSSTTTIKTENSKTKNVSERRSRTFRSRSLSPRKLFGRKRRTRDSEKRVARERLPNIRIEEGAGEEFETVLQGPSAVKNERMVGISDNKEGMDDGKRGPLRTGPDGNTAVATKKGSSMRGQRLLQELYGAESRSFDSMPLARFISSKSLERRGFSRESSDDGDSSNNMMANRSFSFSLSEEDDSELCEPSYDPSSYSDGTSSRSMSDQQSNQSDLSRRDTSSTLTTGRFPPATVGSGIIQNLRLAEDRSSEFETSENSSDSEWSDMESGSSVSDEDVLQHLLLTKYHRKR